jgi:hypothetical protein
MAAGIALGPPAHPCRGDRPRNKKGPGPEIEAFLFKIIPAATYVPTQLPVQYHRPGEA